MDCLSVICLSSLFVTAEGGYQQVSNPLNHEMHEYDRNNADPYLGAFSVGLVVQLNNQFSWRGYYRHESMPRRGDAGVNALWVTVEWRPFK